MTLLVSVVLVALVFEYVNGFHDTANAIATVVSTKVLTPRLAVAWASFWNLIGALSGTAVATTIGKGIVDTSAVTMGVLLCTLLSAVVWGLMTWWLGLPSSSSHALIGGVVGLTVQKKLLFVNDDDDRTPAVLVASALAIVGWFPVT